MQKYFSSIFQIIIISLLLILTIRINDYNYLKDTSIYSIENENYTTEELITLLNTISSSTESNIYFKRYSSTDKKIYTNSTDIPKYSAINFHTLKEFNEEEYSAYLEIYLDDENSEEFIKNATEEELEIKLISEQLTFFQFYGKDMQSLVVSSIFITFSMIYINTHFTIKRKKMEMAILKVHHFRSLSVYFRTVKEDNILLVTTSIIMTAVLMFIMFTANIQNSIFILVPTIITIIIIMFQLISLAFALRISTLHILKGKEKNTITIIFFWFIKILSVITMIISLSTSLYYIKLNNQNIESLNMVETVKDYTIFRITSSSTTGFSEIEVENFIEFYEYISINYEPLIGTSKFMDSAEQTAPDHVCEKNCILSTNDNYFNQYDVYDVNGEKIESSGKEDDIKIYYSEEKKIYKEEIEGYENFFDLEFQYIEIAPEQKLPYIENSGGQVKTGYTDDPIIWEYPPSFSDNSNPITQNIISILTRSNFLIDLPPSEVEKIAMETGNSNNFVKINTIEDTYIVEKNNYIYEIKKNFILALVSICVYILVSFYLTYEIFNIFQRTIMIKYLTRKKLVYSLYKVQIISILPLLIALVYLKIILSTAVTTLLIVFILFNIDVVILLLYSNRLIGQGINNLKGE
ncbi:MAG: hypothetical protein ACRC5M_00880 [Anaeroplasmataceae bacterium]